LNLDSKTGSTTASKYLILAHIMELADFLKKEQILTDLKASDRWEAIEELIELLVVNGQIKAVDREAIISVVKKREASMSTGIGFGIGIPHASTDLIDNVTGAFGRSKGGINFEALDNQPVNLVMLFLVPQGQFQKHLHTLAKIAKVLHKNEFRKSLQEAEDEAEMYQIIRDTQET
tara:strand:+ start:305 stop:832 length:528 start_codon:yes stop_codon:yes gene_type:complete